MGCIWSRKYTTEEVIIAPAKVYSWDKKKENDHVRKLNLVNLENKTIISKACETSNEHFIMDNCHNCIVYALNYLSAVNIDGCTNCKIFLGPTRSSAFIRNTSDCQIAVATQQFRLRDCKRLDIFLYVSTQPIIESSYGINFSCYQANYPQLSDQFEKAGLSIYNNNWHDVYDFTPVHGEIQNFELLPENIDISNYISNTEELGDFKINRSTSLIPFTHPLNFFTDQEHCLVVFFCSPFTKMQINKFIHLMENNEGFLIRSKEFKLSRVDSKKIFGSIYEDETEKGAVTGLEWKGPIGLCDTCQKIAEDIKIEYAGQIFVGGSNFQYIQYFFELAQMMIQNM